MVIFESVNKRTMLRVLRVDFNVMYIFEAYISCLHNAEKKFLTKNLWCSKNICFLLMISDDFYFDNCITFLVKTYILSKKLKHIRVFRPFCAITCCPPKVSFRIS